MEETILKQLETALISYSNLTFHSGNREIKIAELTIILAQAERGYHDWINLSDEEQSGQDGRIRPEGLDLLTAQADAFFSVL